MSHDVKVCDRTEIDTEKLNRKTKADSNGQTNRMSQKHLRGDIEPEADLPPAGTRKESGHLWSSDPRSNTVSSFSFLGSQIGINQKPEAKSLASLWRSRGLF